MSEPESDRPSYSVLVKAAIGVCFLAMVVYLSLPGRISNGWNKSMDIIYNVRRLDGAKEAWALEHGQTNQAVVPTMEDLAPYLRGPRDGEGLDATTGIKPVAGERYFIKSLAESPEAELMRELDGRPKGTVFRMATNVADEIVLPKESH